MNVLARLLLRQQARKVSRVMSPSAPAFALLKSSLLVFLTFRPAAFSPEVCPFSPLRLVFLSSKGGVSSSVVAIIFML